MKKFAYILAAAWLVAACALKEETVAPSAQSKVFTATFEKQGTRTYTAGGKVYWVANDAISIFDHFSADDGGLRYVYAGETGEERGDFTTGDTSSAAQNLGYTYAVYPYAPWNGVLDDGTIYTYIDPDQIYVMDNSFGYSKSIGAGVNSMAAVSDNETLEFKNLCGYLNLKLYGDGSKALNKIVVSSNNGEYISGDIYASFEPGDEPDIVACPDFNYALSYATIYMSEISDVFLSDSSDNAINVWVALTPGAISGGITVTVQAADGSEFTVENTKPLTIKRGVCTNTAPLQVTFPAVDENYMDAFVGDYTFNTTSFYGGDYTGLLHFIAYDSALGNAAFYGSIDGYLATVFYGQCLVDGSITIPYGQTIGTFTYDEQDYDIQLVVADDNYYYTNDIPFTVNENHEMSYVYGQYGYYLGLLGFIGDTPSLWYDKLAVNSIVYTPSEAAAAMAKARGYDPAKGLNSFKTPVKGAPVCAGNALPFQKKL